MGAALRRNIPAIAAGGLVVVTAAAVAVLGVGFAQADARPFAASTSSADGLEYVPIKEVFSTPAGACDEGGTTIEMANCVLAKVISTDQEIDRLQQRRFTDAPTTGTAEAYLKDDARWLRNRVAAVRKIDSGGTLDTVLRAQKTLELSRERLNALR